MSSTAEPVLSASGNTSRFNIPVSHLDFDYIQKCTNLKELEKIYLVLKSGDEGWYPQLQQTCEDKIRELNPNSRILRKENPVATKGDLDHEEWKELDKDLKDWTSDMKYMEDTLKTTQQPPDTNEDSLPPVRSGGITLTSQGARSSKPASNKSVKPREYRDWDKIDIEKELEKVDEDDKPKGRSFVDGKEVKDIPEQVDAKGLTESEKLMKANREKDKGNEAFKSGDYKEAIVYYSRSISLQPTAASYNNRALAYLKTEDWMKAITDTDRVLKLEPENLKALLRQATARKGLKQFDKAKKDLDKVLQKEPNNKRAQDLLQEVEKERKEKKNKGRRMVIEDVEGSDEETEDGSKDSVKGDASGDTSVANVSNSVKENVVVNGDAEPSELEEKKTNKKTPLVNGHVGYAGGDSENSKDIWSADEVEKESKNLPESTSKKDNTCVDKQENPQVQPNENKAISETDSGKISDTSKHIVKEGAELSELINESNSANTVETGTDLKTEQQTKDGATSELQESEKESEDTESDVKSEDNSETDDQIPERDSLTRPVFHQRPFPDNCLKLREEGNMLFKNGQYGEAISIYSKIIGILEHEADQVVNLSLMYSNRAACQLKTGDLSGTVRDCTRSLQLIPHSVKPLLRRAMAYEHLERPRLAYIDYRHVLLLDNRMDQAHLGTKRCQELLHQKDGPLWREKFQLPSVSPWQIPEIIDVDGKPTSQVVVNNPVPSPQQTCSVSQSTLANQKTDNLTNQKADKLGEERKEKVKELSAAEKFEKFKAEGNEFVKKGKFSEAVPCYNKCMEAMPDQVAVYTNRALCYIKLNQPEKAEEDCTSALSLEKDNVKGLFRRAQARKMLGQNKKGIEDLNQLLKVDPTNTAAKKEMEVMKKLWREELDKLKKDMPVSSKEERDHRSKTKEKADTKQRKRMVIEEVESDEDSQGDTKSGGHSKSKSEAEKPKVEELSSPSHNKSQHKPVNNKDKTTHTSDTAQKEPDRKPTGSETQPDRNTIPSTKDNKKSKKKSQIKETSTGLPKVPPSTPKLEKATPYEFISAWNALKKSESLQPYYDLLRQIPAKDLSSVISNKLDGPMLNVMVKCVAEYYIPKGEMDEGFQLLKNLSSVSRFGTVSMFMSAEEHTRMKSVLDKLSSHSSSVYSVGDILKLKKDYSIK